MSPGPEPLDPPPAEATSAPPSIVTDAEEAVRRLSGAAALSAAGVKMGGRPKGARDKKPRKQRADMVPRAETGAQESSADARPLTRVQAVFAAIWCGGQVRDDAEAVQQAYASLELEQPTRPTARRKAERWLRAPQVRAEIERVAQQSSVPAVALAALARRQLRDLLFAEDEHVRHQAVMTALRLNGDLRASQKGTLENGREGASIGTIIIQHLQAGAPVSEEQLARALSDALSRSGRPNEIGLHRHAEGSMPMLPQPGA